MSLSTQQTVKSEWGDKAFQKLACPSSPSSSSKTSSTRSSPSPPPTANGRHPGQRPRRRASSAAGRKPVPPPLDWSTSYNASASSSRADGNLEVNSEDTSTFGESSDSDATPDNVGQPPTPSQRTFSFTAKRASHSPSSTRRTPSSPVKEPCKITPPRSSSMLHPLQHPHPQRPVQSSVLSQHYLLHFWPLPIHAFIDLRRLVEHVLMYAAVCYALFKFVVNKTLVYEPWLVKGMNALFLYPNPNLTDSLTELGTLTAVSAIYMFITRTRTFPIPIPRQENGTSGHKRTQLMFPAVRSEESGRERSFLWMTSERDYRYLIIVRASHSLTHRGQDRCGRWSPHRSTDGAVRRS